MIAIVLFFSSLIAGFIGVVSGMFISFMIGLALFVNILKMR